VNGARGSRNAHIPLSAVDFATADEAVRTAFNGFEVADSAEAHQFAIDLIENGWAREIRPSRA
jgi:hypothetical protein